LNDANQSVLDNVANAPRQTSTIKMHPMHQFVNSALILLLGLNIAIFTYALIGKSKIVFWSLSFILPIATIILSFILTYIMPESWRVSWEGGILAVGGLLLSMFVATSPALYRFSERKNGNTHR